MRSLAARRRSIRSGITLIELMLVLALLVLIAALTVPALQGTLKFERLRAGAEQVRTLMSKARVRAMKSRRIHALWIEPQGSGFRIEPWITGDESLEANQPVAQTGMGPAGAGQLIDPNVLMTQEQLPEGIVFYVAETLQDNRSLMSQQQVGALSGGSPTTIPPILFYPDGTTSTARLTVTNGEGLFVMITLRGMTGIAETSQPLTTQELTLQ